VALLFVDEATIYVKAGNGGNGLVTFRREKYVPRGGPSGGDGGNGGSVIFQVQPGLRTLLDFRYRQRFLARNGEPGGPSNRAGKASEDLVVTVPQGTVIWDTEDGRLVADLAGEEQSAVVARGGRGGRGNARFATSTERAPTFAEKGEPGEERSVRVELRLIADAGLIGLPNAGKSTFLSRVSAARPKIADYPFTTLEPNLGVVGIPGREEAAFVLADIPGLIKGAHAGSGLGDKFLRHIERTRVLVHLVDVAPLDGSPVSAYKDIRQELALYDPALAGKPEIVVATKIDLPEAEDGAKALERHLGGPVLRASPLTGQGLTTVLHAVADLLATAGLPETRPAGEWRTSAREPEPPPVAPDAVSLSPKRLAASRLAAKRGFAVVVEDGVFVVRGLTAERTVVMTDLENPAGLRHLQHVLKRRGVVRALREAGARTGSPVRIGEFEFDFLE